MKAKPVTCLREPCGGDREVVGEASVAVPVGRANEQRKDDGSECRDPRIGRRQYWPHREKVRRGRAPRCQRTHARRYALSRDLGGLPVAGARKRRGRQSEAESEAADARRGGVGLTHSSEEAGEQSAGSRAAESVERRGWRNGRRKGKAMLRTQGREAPRGLYAGTERSGTAVQWAAVTTGARSRMR